MSASPIDYDALAQQHGGATTVDYDTLASQHGGAAAATSSAPIATISNGAPKSFLDSAQQWAENVGNDLKHGTDITGIGTVLQKMGAHGVYSGNSQAVGDFMASLPLGIAKATQGAAEIPQSGKTWQGTKDVVSGGLQAATIPASFIAPEAAEASASGVGNALDKVSPGAMKEAAGGLLQSVAHDANKIPVTLDNAGDAALRLMDWQKKTQLGPTINKFLNRVTNPKLGQMTYEEARDYYQLLGKMSADEQLKLAAPVKRDLAEMVSGLKSDIGNAADQVGRASDYYKGLGDYAKAMKFQDWYDTAKKAGIDAVKYGIPAGLTGFGVKKAIDAATNQ